MEICPKCRSDDLRTAASRRGIQLQDIGFEYKGLSGEFVYTAEARRPTWLEIEIELHRKNPANWLKNWLFAHDWPYSYKQYKTGVAAFDRKVRVKERYRLNMALLENPSVQEAVLEALQWASNVQLAFNRVTLINRGVPPIIETTDITAIQRAVVALAICVERWARTRTGPKGVAGRVLTFKTSSVLKKKLNNLK